MAVIGSSSSTGNHLGQKAHARPLPVWMHRLVLPVLLLGSSYYGYTCIEDGRRDRQEKLRQQREDELSAREAAQKKEIQIRHEEKLLKPKVDMLAEASEIVSVQEKAMPDPEAILAKLDNEKFKVSTGAWYIRTNKHNLEETIRTKLASKLPTVVTDSLTKSILLDSMIVASEREFKIDGREATGHFYKYHLRKIESGNETSVALFVSSTSFDMKKVVDDYETEKTAEYKSVGVRHLRKKGKCVSQTVTGSVCQFPFKYRTFIFFDTKEFMECTTAGSGSLWCATEVDWARNMLDWGRCSSAQTCDEDGYETVLEREFVGWAEKKIPIYSHRALPPGVDQKQITNALDLVASREAQKVMN